MFRKVMLGVLKQVGKKMQDVSLLRVSHILRLGPEGFPARPLMFLQRKSPPPACIMGIYKKPTWWLAMSMRSTAGRIKDGDLVMLATNGAGFSWGASLVQH